MHKAIPVISNQLAAILLGLLGVRLVSTCIAPNVYGEYALLLTLLSLGTMLTHCALLNHLARRWQREQASGSGQDYRAFLWKATWRNSFVLAALLLICGVAMAVLRRQSFWIMAIPALFAGNLAMVFLGIINFLFTVQERHWRVFTANAVASFSRIVLPVLLYVLLAPVMSSLVAGLFLFGLVGILALSPLLHSTAVPGPDQNSRWSEELRAYGRPFVLTGIGAWTLQSADRWVVEHFFESTQVGLFSLASNMGAVVPTVIVGALMQLFFPRFFRQADQADSAKKWQTLARHSDQLTLLLLATTVLGLLGLWAIGPFLVGKLIGSRYAAAISLVVPAGLATLTSQVNQFYYLILQGKHDSRAVVKVMLAVASMKTLGSIAAAAISWRAFLIWLILSAMLATVLGRCMVWRLGRIASPGLASKITSLPL